MAAPVKYDITVKGVMGWASSELEHVGRIVAVEDKRLQRSYAMSTLNGMAHLKDALYQLVNDKAYKHHRPDLLKVHEQVVRVMKHLIKDFDLDIKTIQAFNTNHVLSNLGYLKNSPTRRRTVRRKKN